MPTKAKTGFREAPSHVGLKKVDKPVLPPAFVLEKTKPAKALKSKPAKVVSVHSNQPNTTPTIQIASELQEAYNHFNRKLFEGKLPQCVVKFDRLRKYVGTFQAKQWTTDRKAIEGDTHVIVLDPERLRTQGDKQVLSTLVHEMVHCQIEESGKGPKKAYHCKRWAKAMNDIGLKPVALVKGVRQPDKETGASCTHDIVKGGVFDKSADALLSLGFKLSWLMIAVPVKVKKDKPKKQGVKVKYTADCDTSFWGKGGIVATCQCGCKSKFVAEDSEDEDGDE